MATTIKKTREKAGLTGNPGREVAESFLANRISPFDVPEASIDIVDLFCGCGGISSGFRLVSDRLPVFRLAGAVDIDEDAIDTFAMNLGVRPMQADVNRIVEHAADWKTFTDGLDRRKKNPLIIVGGPPCQGFSSHRTTIVGCETMNTLVLNYAEAAVRLGADAVLMENVPELLTTRSWPFYEAAADILRNAGYVVRTRVYNFAGFGLPQERFRAVTIAMKKAFSMPEPFLKRGGFHTVRQAIEHLPVIVPGAAPDDDADHVTAKHRRSTIDTIAAVSKDGGRRPLDVGPECLRRLAIRNGRTGYDDVYGRLWWDRPSVTITGHSRNPASGRFCHPEQNRGLSVREAALLQGFPPNFRFQGSFDSKFLQVGNAVSPVAAAFLAGHILVELRNKKPREIDSVGDVTQPVGSSFSRLIPGIKSGTLEL